MTKATILARIMSEPPPFGLRGRSHAAPPATGCTLYPTGPVMTVPTRDVRRWGKLRRSGNARIVCVVETAIGVLLVLPVDRQECAIRPHLRKFYRKWTVGTADTITWTDERPSSDVR